MNDGQERSKAAGATLKVLRASDLLAIEQALEKAGPNGQVRLGIRNGRVEIIRTIVQFTTAGTTTVSMSADQPGPEG